MTTAIRELADRLDRRLVAAAAMAGALGPMATSTSAEVMFTDIPDVIVGYGSTIGFDIDGDGASDVFLNNHYAGSEYVAALTGGFGGLTVHNGIPTPYFGGGAYYADNLSAGAAIGSTYSSVSPFTVLYHGPVGGSYGEFSTLGGGPETGKATGNYLGLFFYSGKTSAFHFGWIGIDLVGSTPTVTGFAWDDDPGTTIAAGATGIPEPASAGLFALAAGAAGTRAWRRRRGSPPA